MIFPVAGLLLATMSRERLTVEVRDASPTNYDAQGAPDAGQLSLYPGRAMA